MVLEQEELANEVLRLQEEISQLRGNLTLKCAEFMAMKSENAHFKATLAVLLEEKGRMEEKDG